MYPQKMVVELLVFGKIGKGFFIWSDTPGVQGICRIGPYPFIVVKEKSIASKGTRSAENCCIMGTAAISNHIVNNTKVWKGDELLVVCITVL